MCIICVEFQRDAMTLNEARRAFREIAHTSTEEDQKRHAEEFAGLSDDEFLRRTKEVSGAEPR